MRQGGHQIWIGKNQVFKEESKSCCKIFGFNPLNAKLNPICLLLALLGAHHILHVSRIRVNIKREIKNKPLNSDPNVVHTTSLE
jgi:hypothetical protein